MITFKYRVTNFENLMMECSGHSGEAGTSLECAGASALMAAAVEAVKVRHPPRLDIDMEEGLVRIRCAYNRETAEIANVIVCGFRWLADTSPGEVTVERLPSNYCGRKKK